MFPDTQEVPPFRLLGVVVTFVPAMQNTDDVHDTASKAKDWPGGAIRTPHDVPLKLTAFPPESPAAQNVVDPQESDSTWALSVPVTGHVALAGSEVSRLPALSAAAQNPVAGHDSEVIALDASTVTGPDQVRRAPASCRRRVRPCSATQRP